MKTILLATILLFGPMVTKMNATESISIAVTDGDIQNFHGHRQGSGVGLMWMMNSSTAVSFEIERSYDGEYFESVAQIEATGSGRYRYIDNNVFPGYIHYRIKATHDDGSSEYSEIIVVRIVSKK